MKIDSEAYVYWLDINSHLITFYYDDKKDYTTSIMDLVELNPYDGFGFPFLF